MGFFTAQVELVLASDGSLSGSIDQVMDSKGRVELPGGRPTIALNPVPRANLLSGETAFEIGGTARSGVDGKWGAAFFEGGVAAGTWGVTGDNPFPSPWSAHSARPSSRVVHHRRRRCGAREGRRGAALLWCERLEVGEHRGDQFGDGGADVHCAADHGAGGAGVHHVQDRVDHLVAADAENGCAEDAFRVRVHQHLPEALPASRS